MVETLALELTQHVETYIKTFRPGDTQEWQFVLQEVSQFLQADSLLRIEGESGQSLSRRLPHLSAEVAIHFRGVKVQEAILIGNCQHQVKFSELTLDMFRIMQALERVPSESQEPVDGTAESERIKKGRKNPHKYLLYRPTMSQFLIFLGNAFKELQDNNVLFLYISADGIFNPLVEGFLPDGDEEDPQPLQVSAAPKVSDTDLCKRGGVALNSRRSPEKQQSGMTADCLYPEDLLVYTRKHLFLIVDSDNSEAFDNLPTVFGKQVICLLSPKEQPLEFETSKSGNLFTLFLSDPITAFCFVMGHRTISPEQHVQLKLCRDNFNVELAKLLPTWEDLGETFIPSLCLQLTWIQIPPLLFMLKTASFITS